MSCSQFRQNQIELFLEEHNLDALVLKRVSSFAWATCGAASYINIASTTGEAELVLTPSMKILVTNNIEEARLKKEENLIEQGWEFMSVPWYQKQNLIQEMTAGLNTGTDLPGSKFIDISAPLARTRTFLSPLDRDRFRELGGLCAEAMNAAAHRVQPGLTEYELAGFLAEETEKLGVQVIVNLIATDERIYNFRHPLPTNKKLDRYAMLILCGRKWGLVCSITRLIHFGAMPDELKTKSIAVSQVDVAYLENTRPGASVGDIFQAGLDAYAEVGYPGEWKLHHQGGPAGYEPREFIAVPGSPEIVKVGQAYAWNPSITGTKSEDTILIGEEENEILTTIKGWPVHSLDINGQIFQRPAILVL
jgi:Xaa-Pro aminopeptidase